MTADKDALVYDIGALLVHDSRLSATEWRNLVIVARMSDDEMEANGFAYQDDGRAIPTAPGNFGALDRLEELREAMHEPGKQPWQACLIRIERASEHMTMDFTYDDPQKWLIHPDTVQQMAETLRPMTADSVTATGHPCR